MYTSANQNTELEHWRDKSKGHAHGMPSLNPYEFLGNPLQLVRSSIPMNSVSEGKLIRPSDGCELYVVDFTETYDVYSKTYSSDDFSSQKPTACTSSYSYKNSTFSNTHIHNTSANATVSFPTRIAIGASVRLVTSTFPGGCQVSVYAFGGGFHGGRETAEAILTPRAVTLPGHLLRQPTCGHATSSQNPRIVP